MKMLPICIKDLKISPFMCIKYKNPGFYVVNIAHNCLYYKHVKLTGKLFKDYVENLLNWIKNNMPWLINYIVIYCFTYNKFILNA